MVCAAIGNGFSGTFFVLGAAISKADLGGAGAWALILASFSVGGLIGGAAVLRIRPHRPLLAGCLVLLPWAVPPAALALRAPVVVIVACALVSGAGLTKEAALAFVILEKLGQNKVSLLMDGADAWAKEGLLVTKEPTIVGPKKSPRDFAVMPATYTSEPRKEIVIPDAQSTKGIYPKVFIASGKDLPAKTPDGKVIHVVYTELLNADGSPKAAKDIWAILTKAGLTRSGR